MGYSRIFDGMVQVAEWWTESKVVNRCAVALVPAMAFAFWFVPARFGDDDGLLFRIGWSVFFPIVAYVLATIVLLCVVVALSRSDSQDRQDVVYMCGVAVVYWQLGVMAAKGNEADQRDKLLDRAAQHLIENGERQTVENLKRAMRFVEDSDEAIEAEARPEWEP